MVSASFRAYKNWPFQCSRMSAVTAGQAWAGHCLFGHRDCRGSRAFRGRPGVSPKDREFQRKAGVFPCLRKAWGFHERQGFSAEAEVFRENPGVSAESRGCPLKTTVSNQIRSSVACAGRLGTHGTKKQSRKNKKNRKGIKPSFVLCARPLFFGWKRDGLQRGQQRRIRPVSVVFFERRPCQCFSFPPPTTGTRA